MFCPRCSTENVESTKFCRKCGLALSHVQLILQGKMEELTEKVKRGEDLLSGGAVTLLIFCVVALISIFFSSGRSFTGAINIVIGLLITVPMIYRGMKRLERARKLFDGEAKAEALPHKTLSELPAAPTTDRSLTMPQSLPSITEHTTYELQQPDTSPPPPQRQREG